MRLDATAPFSAPRSDAGTVDESKPWRFSAPPRSALNVNAFKRSPGIPRTSCGCDGSRSRTGTVGQLLTFVNGGFAEVRERRHHRRQRPTASAKARPTLFAALSRLDGTVISKCQPRLRHEEWLTSCGDAVDPAHYMPQPVHREMGGHERCSFIANLDACIAATGDPDPVCCSRIRPAGRSA